MAAEEVLLRRRRSATRASAARAAGVPQLSINLRGLRLAARQDLRRDRHRSAQHAQVPGHGAAARRCRALRAPAISSSSRRSPGRLQRDDASLFDGVDTSIAGLAQFAGARPPRELTDGLAAIAAAVQNAQQRFDDARATTRRCSRSSTGLRAVRALRGQLRAMHDRRGGPLRDRVPAAPEGARVPAGHSAGQRRPHRSAGRRRRRRARAAGARVGDRRQPRRRGRRRQAGEVRRVSTVTPTCTLTGGRGRRRQGSRRRGAPLRAARRSRRSREDQVGAVRRRR